MGCKEPKAYNSGYCEKHGGGQRSAKQKANLKMYKSTSWQKLRIAKLSEFPLCNSCLSQGIVNEAKHLDHVFPHKQDKERFVINLFQGLCPACHTQKTRLENQGIYRYYTSDGYIDYSESDYAEIMKRHFFS